jgi:hypothetical protein
MLFNPADTFLYLTQMLHAHAGEWLWTDNFTYVREPPLFLFGLYTLMGKAIIGPANVVSEGLMFHGVRLLLAALFIHQAWKLYGELLPGRVARRVALLFVLFTAGMGAYRFFFFWLPPPGSDRFPFDIAFIESSSLFGLLYAPHFAAVLLLMVIYLRALFRALSTAAGGWRATLVGALAAALLATIHPEKVGVLAITTVLYLAVLQLQGGGGLRQWFKGALMVAGGVPYTAFAFLLTVNDKQVVELLRQGRPHQPPPDPWFYYPLGYGIPLLAALSGLPRLLRRLRSAPRGEVLLWCTVVAGIVILLTPWHALDHRAEGLQLALAGLAGRNLTRVALPRVWRARWFAAAINAGLFRSRRRARHLSVNLTLIFSSVTILALAFGSPRAGLQDSTEIYLTRDDSAALGWISSNLDRDQLVVAGPESAQFVAAYGGTRVVFGNWAFTPNFDAEARNLLAFFQARTDLRAYLDNRQVGWFYYGPREQAVSAFDPAALPFLRPVYRTGNTVIYRVVRDVALRYGAFVRYSRASPDE